MGPVYALVMATVTAFIRMSTQGIPPWPSLELLLEPSLQVSFISTVENFTILPLERFWEQGLSDPLFPILSWFSLRDLRQSSAGLSILRVFLERP